MHEPVRLTGMQRRIVRALDGTNDQNALVALLEEDVRTGAFTVREQGEPIQDAGRARSVLQEIFRENL